MNERDVYRARSIIGSEFVCRIARPAEIGGRPGIVPIISGRAWITGVNQYMLDPGLAVIGLRTLGPAKGKQPERLAQFALSLDAKTAMKYVSSRPFVASPNRF